MGLETGLLNALKVMGLATPTPIQSEAIPIALLGTDVVGVAQTGSGKTLAYALAVMTRLLRNPKARALILSPSRETAEQIHRVLTTLCAQTPVSLTLAATGVTNAILAREFKKQPRLMVATPGRIVEHLENNKLLLQGLEVLVIDEADRMLEMGFEKQLKFIHSTLRGQWQTLMFAASFGPNSEPMAALLLKPDAVLIRSKGAETAVASLQQRVLFLKGAQKNHRLLDELKRRKDAVMIFADSQERCVELGRWLAHQGFSSEFVHGDMNPGHRNRVLREFREQKISVLVTTDLLARGLDIEHLNCVVSYDLPYKAEDFLHRIGRTARAGREGLAITFVTPADGRTYRKMKSYLQGAEEETVATDFKFDDRS